jgi:hypothetical protein
LLFLAPTSLILKKKSEKRRGKCNINFLHRQMIKAE